MCVAQAIQLTDGRMDGWIPFPHPPNCSVRVVVDKALGAFVVAGVLCCFIAVAAVAVVVVVVVVVAFISPCFCSLFSSAFSLVVSLGVLCRFWLVAVFVGIPASFKS